MILFVYTLSVLVYYLIMRLVFKKDKDAFKNRRGENELIFYIIIMFIPFLNIAITIFFIWVIFEEIKISDKFMQRFFLIKDRNSEK